MSNEMIRHVVRTLIILLIQVLVLKRLSTGTSWLWLYGSIFLYPVVVLLLPFRLSRHFVILLGFAVGLLMDIFYDSIGVHAFALTATAYLRGHILTYMEPRGGYQITMSPTHYSMGLNWLITYTALLMAGHLLVYYTIEIFTFVYVGKILLKALVTFFLSMVVIMGFHLLFNPKK